MNDVKKILIAAISVVLVVAIVAGVSIGVLAGTVNGMKDQIAELNQTVETLQSENDAMKAEIAEATANNEKLVTAEDFEAKLAAAIGEQNQTMQALVSTAVKNQIEELGVEGLTEAQVKEIINAAVANCITEDEVNELIANSDTGLTEAQVKKLITNANAGFLTYAQIVNLIDDNIYDLRNYLEAMINGKTTLLAIEADDVDGDTFTIDDDVLADVIDGSYVELIGDWTEINLVIDYDDDKEVWICAETPVATLKNKVSEKAHEDIEVLEASVSSVNAFIEAIEAGVPTVIATDDIDLDGETLEIPVGVTMVLDLNGNTLTGAIIAQNADLTIVDGTIENDDETKSAIEINAGTLTLVDVEIESARHAVRIDGDVVATIDGGTYVAGGTSGLTQHAVNVSGNATLTINGGTFVGPRGTGSDSGAAVNVQSGATVLITDGNFSGGLNDTLANSGKLSVAGGTFDQNPSAYCGSATVTANSDGTYTVSPAKASTNADLSTAITAGTIYIELGKGEFTLPSLSGKQGMTLIGAADGSTVIGGENVGTGFGSQFGKDTTIKNITFSGSTNGVRYSYAQGGTSVFENCTFAGGSTYGFHIDSSNGATFVFNNCTFVGFNAFAGDLESVTFNNCTFKSNGSYGHTNIWSTGHFNDCTFEEGATYGVRGDGVIYINGVQQ